LVGSVEGAVAHAAVSGGRNLRVQDVEDGCDHIGADRADGEVLLKLRVPLVGVWQPSAAARLHVHDAIALLRRVRGGDVVGRAARWPRPRAWLPEEEELQKGIGAVMG